MANATRTAGRVSHRRRSFEKADPDRTQATWQAVERYGRFLGTPVSLSGVRPLECRIVKGSDPGCAKIGPIVPMRSRSLRSHAVAVALLAIQVSVSALGMIGMCVDRPHTHGGVPGT